MISVQDLYVKFKTPPELQMHMLRSAGVAKIICDNFKLFINKENIIFASLLHDMGNIIKFKLDAFPESEIYKNRFYWKKVQDEFVNKYGRNEHFANVLIAKEIGLSNKIVDLIEHSTSDSAIENTKESNYERKIRFYSDSRVSPKGIVTLDERIKDIENRYNSNSDSSRYPIEKLKQINEATKIIEKQIFEQCTILPNDIDDTKICELIDSLRNMIII